VRDGGTFTVNCGSINGEGKVTVDSNGTANISNSMLNNRSITFSSGSSGSISGSEGEFTLYLNSGANVRVRNNDLSQVSISISGDKDSIIDLSGNYWGTASVSAIYDRIYGDANRDLLPQVVINSVLTEAPDTIEIDVSLISVSPALYFNSGDQLGEVALKIRNSSYVAKEDLTYNVSLRLSTDTGYSSDDLLIGTFQFSDIDFTPGDSIIVNIPEDSNFTIPGGISGSAYIIAEISPGQSNTPNDPNMNNNYSFAQVILNTMSDLAIVEDSITFTNETYSPGEMVTLNWEVINNGDDAGSSVQGIYFYGSESAPDGVSYTERLLTTETLDSMNAGESADESALITLPDYVGAGTYYLKVVQDYDDQIDESNENNNYSVVQIQIGEPDPDPADIVLSGISLADDTFAPGEELGDIIIGLGNNSPADIEDGSYYLSLFLSTDAAFSQDDEYLAGYQLHGLDISSYSSKEITLPGNSNWTVPEDVLGEYYVVGVLEPDTGAPSDPDMSNNQSASDQITIKPTADLELISVTSENTLFNLGTQTLNTFTVEVKNNSASAVDGEYDIKFYLSTDQNLEYPGDHLLGAAMTNISIAAGETESLSLPMSILPVGIEAGDYYIVASLFPTENAPTDPDTSNNQFSTQIYIENFQGLTLVVDALENLKKTAAKVIDRHIDLFAENVAEVIVATRDSDDDDVLKGLKLTSLALGVASGGLSSAVGHADLADEVLEFAGLLGEAFSDGLSAVNNDWIVEPRIIKSLYSTWANEQIDWLLDRETSQSEIEADLVSYLSEDDNSSENFNDILTGIENDVNDYISHLMTGEHDDYEIAGVINYLNRISATLDSSIYRETNMYPVSGDFYGVIGSSTTHDSTIRGLLNDLEEGKSNEWIFAAASIAAGVAKVGAAIGTLGASFAIEVAGTLITVGNLLNDKYKLSTENSLYSALCMEYGAVYNDAYNIVDLIYNVTDYLTEQESDWDDVTDISVESVETSLYYVNNCYYYATGQNNLQGAVTVTNNNNFAIDATLYVDVWNMDGNVVLDGPLMVSVSETETIAANSEKIIYIGDLILPGSAIGSNAYCANGHLAIGTPLDMEIIELGESEFYIYPESVSETVIDPTIFTGSWTIENNDFVQVVFSDGLAVKSQFILNPESDALDLHVYDFAGNHVGINYDTGEIDLEIPGATYQGGGETGIQEYIVLSDSGGQEYTLKITGNGSEEADGKSFTLVHEDIPDNPATLSASVTELAEDSRPGEMAEFSTYIWEIGKIHDFENLNAVLDCLSDGDNSINADSFMITLSDTTVEAGSNVYCEVEVDTSGVADGCYTGTLVLGNGEETALEIPVSLMVDGVAPDSPNGLQANIDNGTVSLDWSDVSDTGSGLKRYVYQYASNSSFTDSLSGWAGTSEFNLSNLEYGTYYWRVKSVDNAGNESAWSTVESFCFSPHRKNDFDGNSRSDVIRYLFDSGHVKLYLNGADSVEQKIVGGVDAASWDYVGTGDFNSDGATDVLWRNKSTGLVGAWLLDKGTGNYSSWSSIAGAAIGEWEISGVGDFNGDKTDDVLWYNTQSGLMGAWLVDNGVYSAWSGIAGADPSSWSFSGIGDFNNDNMDDILWCNNDTGLTGAWLLDNGTYSAWTSIAGADLANWELSGVGDFNGDGTDDVLWCNKDTGLTGAWLLGNGAYSAWTSMAGADLANWQLEGVGDYNGDGTEDVLWCNSETGLLGYWQIENGQYTNWATIA
jgi:hypothetical protein